MLTGIEKLIAEDLEARQRKGVEKYGTSVEHNPGPLAYWLRHAYEEALDLAVYLRRAISEVEEE